MITAREFVARLAPVELERLVVIFDYLADHQHELCLANRQPLRDGLDFATFHREVAAALKFQHSGPIKVMGEFVIEDLPEDHSCPDCEHEHGGREECGYYLGEGKFCRCPAKVAA